MNLDAGGMLQTLLAVAQDILTFLDHGWIGTVIGILGLIVAYYFYRLSRQGAQLAFQRQGFRLLGGKGRTLPADVKILFRDRAIENLCRTIVVIWNHSDKTVYGANVVDTDKIRIHLPSATILDARVLACTRDVIGCSVQVGSPTENEVIVSFEYLDSRDGLVVEMFHTEPTARLTLAGTIREMPRGFRDFGMLAPLSLFSEILSWITLLLGTCFAGIVIFGLVTVVGQGSVAKIVVLSILLLLAIAYAAGGVVGIVQARCKFPRSLLLPEFRSFFARSSLPGFLSHNAP